MKPQQAGKYFNFRFQRELRRPAEIDAERKGISLAAWVSIAVSEKLDRESRPLQSAA